MTSTAETNIKKVEEDVCYSHNRCVVVALRNTNRHLSEINKAIPARSME